MKVKTLKGLKKEASQKALVAKQLTNVRGGTWFEDDEEFVKQIDSVKSH